MEPEVYNKEIVIT